MSAPAFAWAFEKGVELGLTPSQLLLLAYMADQANCVGSFFTGQPRLAQYTRLDERTIRRLIPQLEALGLIRVTSTPGKSTQYHILRQPIGADSVSAQAITPSQATVSAPANGAGVTQGTASAPPRTPCPPHPGHSLQPPRTLTSLTPDTTPADPYLPKKITQERARVRAQGSEDFSDREQEASKQAAPPPPAAQPKAPVLSTTSSGGRSDTPMRSSDAFLDDPSPDDALPRAEADAIASDDLPITDPALAIAQWERVKQALRSRNYPPRAATMSAEDQIDELLPRRPKPSYLPDDYLRAARADLAARAAAKGIRPNA